MFIEVRPKDINHPMQRRWWPRRRRWHHRGSRSLHPIIAPLPRLLGLLLLNPRHLALDVFGGGAHLKVVPASVVADHQTS
jgi:uncharacterized metal-binding protein